MIRLSIILTAAVFGCVIASATAQETAASKELQVGETRETIDPTGAWHSTVNFRGRDVKSIVRISSVKEGNVEGTFTRIGESELKIEDGTIEGDQLSFTVSAERQGVAFTTKYSGKIDGDKIVGKAVLNLPNRSIGFEWNANKDGKLTAEKVDAHRKQTAGALRAQETRRGRVPQDFAYEPGWEADRFPEHAVCYRSPSEIADLLAGVAGVGAKPVTSYPKPQDGSLRIVGTGHSFMLPGYRTFPAITRAAGFKQPPLLTHIGGGITGSARYKWEQENGIFQFDGNPTPKLLASIANAEWDVFMWGPYGQDIPKYYSCWIDFCLKFSPGMKFYLSDAWPTLKQLGRIPKSEEELSAETIRQMGRERHEVYATLIGALNKDYPGKVFVLPTSEAMVLAAESYHRGELPGVDGVHAVVGKQERSLWRDQRGHLGPGFDRLEGYVFYATVYGRSPELIEGDVPFGGSSKFPSRELDREFRRIAWQAALDNPLAGVIDADGNKISDDRE